MDSSYKPLKTKRTPLQVSFGVRVASKRHQKKLSQEKLAELCDLHTTYISSVERGERNISLANIYKIATALDCLMADLMLYSDTDIVLD